MTAGPAPRVPGAPADGPTWGLLPPRFENSSTLLDDRISNHDAAIPDLGQANNFRIF